VEVVRLKARSPSEYNRGTAAGMAGEELPSDVSLYSDFACGWRFGCDMRLAAPKVSIITHEDHCQSKYDDLPLTWPEGREGAAAMIPPHRPQLKRLYHDDPEAIRNDGGPVVSWSLPIK